MSLDPCLHNPVPCRRPLGAPSRSRGPGEGHTAQLTPCRNRPKLTLASFQIGFAAHREHYRLVASADSLEILLRIVQQYDLPFKRLAGEAVMSPGQGQSLQCPNAEIPHPSPQSTCWLCCPP